MVCTPASASVPSSASQPASLRVAYFGDSFTWGQGNHTDDKFSRLFARDLEARTGIPVDTSDYSHSGAPLSLYHDGQPPLSTGPCDAGFATPGEVPSPSPAVLDCQIPAAAESGHRFDLVVLDGCIVDIGVFPPADATDYRSQTALSSGTLSIPEAMDTYCKKQLASSIQAAHALPGNPNVAIVGAHYPFSEQSVPDEVANALNGSLGSQVSDSFVEQFIARNSDYVGHYRQIARDAIVSAGDWATYVESGLGPENALFAPQSKQWNGTDDPLFAERTAQCAPYLAEFPACPLASIAHPNSAGQQQIAANLINNPSITSWFPQR